MIRINSLKKNITNINKVSSIFVRSYLSYPDPNEKPKISTFNPSSSTSISSFPTSISSSSPASSYKINPLFDLSKPYPTKTEIVPISLSKPFEPIIFNLDNNLTVTIKDHVGIMSTVSFLVHAGSAYEENHNIGEKSAKGMTNLFEFLGFASTSTRTSDELIKEIEELGGSCQLFMNREVMIFTLDVLRENLHKSIELLSDAILNATFEEEEIEQSKMISKYQHEGLLSNAISLNLLHKAAFPNSPLGNSFYAEEEDLKKITRQDFINFKNNFFYGGNCVLSIVGLNANKTTGEEDDHNDLKELISKTFSKLPSHSKLNAKYRKFGIPTYNKENLLQNKLSKSLDCKQVENKKSTFVGGLVLKECELKDEYVKLAVGFPIEGGYSSESMVAACVIQFLLGGGSSFSSGGPGKGIFSRLYTQVLCQYHFAESIECSVSLYDDNGLIVIDSSCPSDYLPSMLEIIESHFFSLAYSEIEDGELERAKRMLKSSLMMQLETRIINSEDNARQLMTYGLIESPKRLCEKIDLITAEDIRNLARKAIKNNPAIAVAGQNISNFPPYENILKFHHNNINELESKNK